MPRSTEALAKPDLLRWARESAGLSVAAAASKARITPDRLEVWEQGDARPTVAQLRKLANIYKRPLAAFYLPRVPRPLPELQDFRRAPTAARAQSPELRLAHRQAVHRRNVALELFERIGETPPEFALSADTNDDPESAGGRLRQQLCLAPDEHRAWRQVNEALNGWRYACESAGVLVCQASRVDTSEMSGFSLAQLPLPVIVLNIRDVQQRRIFTLLHETVHLAINQGGLCELDDRPGRDETEERVEVFCNAVAAAVLLPLEQLLNHRAVRDREPSPTWSDQEIDALAATYKVSREVALRRLLTAGLTTHEFYARKREELVQAYRDMPPRSDEGGPPQHRVAVNRAGPHFAELVLRAYHLEHITLGDVAQYLRLRAKHIPKLERELLRRRARRNA